MQLVQEWFFDVMSKLLIKDLSLERLRKILRNHYGVKNLTELY